MGKICPGRINIPPPEFRRAYCDQVYLVCFLLSVNKYTLVSWTKFFWTFFCIFVLFINALFMKCPVYEMLCLWNALFIKCPVYEMPCLWNVLFIKYPVSEMPCFWNALFMKCPVCEMSCLWNVLAIKCLGYEMFCMWNVLSMIYLLNEVYIIIRITNSKVWSSK